MLVSSSDSLTRANPAKEHFSVVRMKQRLTRVEIQKNLNAQLRVECKQVRIPLSQTLPELLAYVEEHSGNDFLLKPSKNAAKENPFRAKSGLCVIS